MKYSKSSREWLKEHFTDTYVKQAQQDGYRSRAAYKLLEIQKRDRIMKPGMCVVDLGAAPGGWSQVAAKIVGDKGSVVALDLLDMPEINNVDFMQADFTKEESLDLLMTKLNDKKPQVVLSDMAPNMSGISGVDIPKSMYLVELSVDFCVRVLAPGGCFLTKVFQGEGFQDLLANLRQNFTKVVTRKPDASRARSKELYLLASGFKINRV